MPLKTLTAPITAPRTLPLEVSAIASPRATLEATPAHGVRYAPAANREACFTKTRRLDVCAIFSSLELCLVSNALET